MVKFSHTLFALPFAIIGYFLGIENAQFNFDILLFVKVILCMVFARNAAMAFNRYIDRDIDAKNERTAIREVASGLIQPKNALIFVIINCLLFVLTTYFINPLCFKLSGVALAVILGYSFTKRFTFLCHLILGIGLSLAPIGAYIAVTGEFATLPILFSFIVLFWVSGFDIIYALQDEAFDKSNKLKSIPAMVGKSKALFVSITLHILSSIFIVEAGLFGAFNFLYWIGAILFTMLLAYQHTLVKPNDLSKVDLAFFTSNGIASVIFCVFVVLSLLLY